MTSEERIKLLLEARDLGMKSVTVEGVTYEFGEPKKQVVEAITDLTEEQVKALVNPMSVLDDYSDDEVLYYSTPYFDELQERKNLREQQLKDGVLHGEEAVRPPQRYIAGRKGHGTKRA